MRTPCTTDEVSITARRGVLRAMRTVAGALRSVYWSRRPSALRRTRRSRKKMSSSRCPLSGKVTCSGKPPFFAEWLSVNDTFRTVISPSAAVSTAREGAVSVEREIDPPVRGMSVKRVRPSARNTSSGCSPVVSRTHGTGLVAPSCPMAASAFVSMRAAQSRPTAHDTTRGALSDTSKVHSSAAAPIVANARTAKMIFMLSSSFKSVAIITCQLV